MSEPLFRLLERSNGVVTRAQALTVVSHDVLDRLAARGVTLQRAFPEVFVLSALLDDPGTRRRAALEYVRDGALSHLDSLDEWQLPCDAADPADQRTHVTVNETRPVARVQGIAFHRRRGFVVGAPLTVERNECALVRLEQAVVESWPLISPPGRRAPAIVAVRLRRTRPERLLATLERQPRTAGAGEMRRLFTAMKDGCQSELELWGHEHVFTHPSLPRSQGQFHVRLGRRVVYLDRTFVEEMVGVEMDGAAYHSLPAHRERDLRRDAMLARLGWLIVRFTHQRLHTDAAGVRQELCAILRMRRRQLGLQPA